MNLILPKHRNIFSLPGEDKERFSAGQGYFHFQLDGILITKHEQREKQEDFPTFDCDHTLSTNKSSSVHKDSSKEQFDLSLKSTGVHQMSLVL